MNLLKPNLLGVLALVVIIPSILCGTSLLSSAAGAAISSNFSLATPIKHLVVIFQENVSFDHYFATYPKAANNNGSGEPSFLAKSGTPSVNGLSTTGFLTYFIFPISVARMQLPLYLLNYTFFAKKWCKSAPFRFHCVL